MHKHIRLGATISLVITGACGEPAVSDGPWTAETTHLSDTVVVQTLSGSGWERPARLAEELRLGSIEGGDVAAFGDVSHVAVASDGSIFIFDAQVPQLYRFDANGTLLGRVGREGQGPGEYTGDVTGLLVLEDRVLLADPNNARLSAFAMDGTFEGSIGQVSGLRSLFSPAMALGPDGGIALSVLMVQPTPGSPMPDPWPIGLEIRGQGGDVLDTVRPQQLQGAPARTVAGPNGESVLVASETEFLFELRYHSGGALRVRMPFARVPYSEGEARMLGRALAPVAVADGKADVATPLLKGAYLEYLYSPRGQVWARRPASDSGKEASWRAPRYQPSVLDVFEPDGTYLGVVAMPTNSRPVAVTDTHVYLIVLGSLDEQYVVRYRVDAPR